MIHNMSTLSYALIDVYDKMGGVIKLVAIDFAIP